MSNLPPGVTGNEPHLSGKDDPDNVIDYALEELKKARHIVGELHGYVDDQADSKCDALATMDECVANIDDAIREFEALQNQEPDYEAMAEREHEDDMREPQSADDLRRMDP